MPLGMRHESVRLPTPHARGRGVGGVSLLIQEHVDYKLLRKKASVLVQYVAIAIQDLTIVGAYINPGVRGEKLCKIEEFIEEIRQLTPGRVCILGDLNARHRRWDSTSNVRGQELLRVCRRRGWRIWAPNEPTYRGAANNESTIDLMITRGCDPTTLVVPRGDWDGCSDHSPVVASLRARWNRRSYRPGRISQARRKNAGALARAEEVFPNTLPYWTEQIREARTPEELQDAYDGMARALLNPWRPTTRGVNPERYREFWSEELEKLSKKRSKLYRRVVKSQQQEHWNAFKTVDRRIKRMARRAKRRCYRQFLADLSAAPPAQATKNVKAIVDARKGNARKNGLINPTVEPSLFTEYIDSLQQDAGAHTRISTLHGTRRTEEGHRAGGPSSKAHQGIGPRRNFRRSAQSQ